MDYHLIEDGFFARTVQIDPLQALPGRGTTVAPPALEGGQVARWAGGTWEVLPGRPAPFPLVVSADALRTTLTAEYERRMQAIAAGYPPSERESWPVQTQEAKALLADANASTPWIDAAATARAIDRIELAQRIVAKDAMYRVFSGTLSGVRQRIEDQIDAAGDDQAALKAIDVTAGWPEA